MRDDDAYPRGTNARIDDRAGGFAGVAVFTADWDIDAPKPPAAAGAITDRPLHAVHLDRNSTQTAAKAEKAGSGPGWFGWTSATMWLGASVGAPIAYWGPEALLSQHPALLTAMGAGAVFPALMILVGSAAARAAGRARDEARRLSALASEALSPSEAPVAALEKFGQAVRSEMREIESVVEAAISRLGALEQTTVRQRQEFARVVEEAEIGAKTLTAVFDRELGAADRLNENLRDQTEQMGQSVGRQIRLMREASRLVNDEVGAAERAFANTFEAFTQVGAQLADRTGQLSEATGCAREATSALDQTMGRALDSLSQATSLTDASRQSVEAAASVAVETAGALKETAQRAVAEARRAAQAIRAETAAMQDQAAETLAKLQEAAAQARAASENANAAAEHQAAAIQRRLGALAETARAARAEAPIEAPAARRANARVTPASEPVYAGPRTAPARESLFPTGWGRQNAKRDAEPAPARSQPKRNLGDFFAPAEAAANDRNNGWSQRRRDPGPMSLLEEAGVRIDEILPEADLERVSIRARLGQSARRRAVMEMAPEAVQRLCAHFEADAGALAAAQEFRRNPGLPEDASRRDSREGDLVAAYLVIDAALG